MKKRMMAAVIIAILLIVTIAFASAHNNILQHVLGKPTVKAINKDTVHIHGKIQKIINTSVDYIEITIINDKKTLVLLVNNETYIGNYTKSPAKQIDYLKKEMSIDVNYYKQNNKLIATTINVIN